MIGRRRRALVTLERFDRWFVAAEAWLDSNPDRLAALLAWDAEMVDGSGHFTTSDWPGWHDAPMGPWPQ